jgi:Ca-activated chloride channel homolog
MKTPILHLLMVIVAITIGIEEPSQSNQNAETETGSIKGKVKDKANNEAIPFAKVILEKNGKMINESTTDFDGNYLFKDLDIGEYVLKAAFVGYQPTIITGISVKPSKVTFVDIELKQGIELKAFEKVEYEVPLISKDMSTSGGVIVRSDISRMPGRSSTISAKNVRGARSSTNFYNEQDNESYEHYRPNSFEHVLDAPLSTFSIDVDAASYSNARRFIQQGNMPPADAIRTEEFINYFTYDYPQPLENVPFSIITELGPCPWNQKNKLLHIGLQGRKIEADQLPPGNFVFLIDVSGSMDAPNRLPLVKKSLRLLVNELRKEDKISIVVYAGAAGLVLAPTRGDYKDKIMDAIENLSAGGSTAGGQGIALAYKIAKENFIKNGNNRVILATDGDFNVGISSDNELVKLIEEKREDGIFLTILGYGMGNYKDSKLEKLANKGNGNYAYIDNLQEAQKVLVKEMGATLLTIAKDVKIQIEFNPSLIKGYRLVGYENRMLEAKDFNDDKKDAGELGAGHTVTALYELITSDESWLPKVDPLKYQQKKVKENTFNPEEFATVKFRYKEPKEAKSKLISVVVKDEIESLDKTSDDFKFSASVAQFGMILNKSEFKGNADYGNTLEMAKKSKSKDEEGYRAEFIRLVELTSKIDVDRKTVKK